MKCKLDIVIPSRNRIEKLKICITSIKEAIKELSDIETKIIIYIDSKEYAEEIYKEKSNIFVDVHIETLKEEYRAARFWNNYIKNMEADVLCYLNDDVKLDKNCLKYGLEELASLDNDGVVGFYQSNQVGTTNCNAAFGLISSEFADLFQDRQIMCPDYYCFYLDEELMKCAQSINKFIGSTKATLEHYHPVFTHQKPDETHKHLRRYKNRDINVYRIRNQKGYIWGKTFDRVTTD